MKKQTVYFFAVFFLVCFHVNAQKDLNFDENIRNLIEKGNRINDSTVIQPDAASEGEILISFENNEISNVDTVVHTLQLPVQRAGRRDPLQMSDEALYWSRYATSSYNKFGSYVTYRDTIIVNPLFMPPLFKKGNVMPFDSISFYQPVSFTKETWNEPLYYPVKILERQDLRLKLENGAYRYIQHHKPYIFDYTAESLPSEEIRYIRQTEKTQRYVHVERKEPSADEITSPVKFIPDRQYWTSSFESAIKFSENYASDNWHKGGTETAILNIFTKNIFQYNYEKDKIKLDNKFEANTSIYSAPKDSVHDYKVGDDLLHFYSNLGLKAFDNWHYTFNIDLKTQMFTNFQENSSFEQAAFLAPYTVKLGLGMEYNYKKQYKRKDRSLNLKVNIAPFSYSFMHTIRDSIDFGRHSFEKDEVTGEFKHSLSRFGSNIKFEMTLNPNRNVTWKSYFNYYTSYDRIVVDFENSLDLAVSRYFSTLIYLNLRYDDGVTRTDSDDSFLQFNQLLSFGFSYKW
ncbi:MAG: DUF3078 domain-containing protein [Tannerella sp.]|jgi:hypothetical protein|nr:DUF3078 domain-containing protein [Tannerella sp.]